MSQQNTLNEQTRIVRQTEQIIDILFSQESIPDEEAERIRQWLSDEKHGQVKMRILRKKFREFYRYEKNPEFAPQMWPELARRLNLSVEYRGGAMPQKIVKIPFYRRTIFKVAAMLVPLLTVATLWRWQAHRQADDVPAWETEWITVTVPPGTMQTLMLPDGSRVELKENSRLVYSGDFHHNRNVTLEGEAFFSVTKQDGQAFTVDGGEVLITVLGTEFNVRAYEDSPQSEVTLASGSVSVTTEEQVVTLEPLQRIRIHKEEQTIELEEIGVGELLRLRGLALRFDGTPLGEVFKLVGQYLDVSVVVTRPMDLTEPVYVEFGEDATPEDIFFIIQAAYPRFDYSMQDEQIIIRPR